MRTNKCNDQFNRDFHLPISLYPYKISIKQIK